MDVVYNLLGVGVACQCIVIAHTHKASSDQQLVNAPLGQTSLVGSALRSMILRTGQEEVPKFIQGVVWGTHL